MATLLIKGVRWPLEQTDNAYLITSNARRSSYLSHQRNEQRGSGWRLTWVNRTWAEAQALLAAFDGANGAAGQVQLEHPDLGLLPVYFDSDSMRMSRRGHDSWTVTATIRLDLVEETE